MKMSYKADGGWIFLLLVVILAVAIIAIGPLLVIWALNTLFPALAIPFTIWTWLAAVIMGAVLSPTVRITKK
jgi:hypothetical protein